MRMKEMDNRTKQTGDRGRRTGAWRLVTELRLAESWTLDTTMVLTRVVWSGAAGGLVSGPEVAC